MGQNGDFHDVGTRPMRPLDAPLEPPSACPSPLCSHTAASSPQLAVRRPPIHLSSPCAVLFGWLFLFVLGLVLLLFYLFFVLPCNPDWPPTHEPLASATLESGRPS